MKIVENKTLSKFEYAQNNELENDIKEKDEIISDLNVLLNKNVVELRQCINNMETKKHNPNNNEIKGHTTLYYIKFRYNYFNSVVHHTNKKILLLNIYTKRS